MAGILAANNLYAIINNEIDYFTGEKLWKTETYERSYFC